MSINHQKDTMSNHHISKQDLTLPAVTEEIIGVLEPVFYFNGAMPTGLLFHIRDAFLLTFQSGEMMCNLQSPK